MKVLCNEAEENCREKKKNENQAGAYYMTPDRMQKRDFHSSSFLASFLMPRYTKLSSEQAFFLLLYICI